MSENLGNEKVLTEQDTEKETLQPQVHIEFNYKNIYGQVFASHKIDTWTIPERPRFDANTLDGYITTDFGSFAIEKPVSVAIEAIADIKEFCRLSQEMTGAEKMLAEAESQHQVSVSRFQRLNDTDSWKKTNNQVETLRRQISGLRRALDVIKPRIQEYRI